MSCDGHPFYILVSTTIGKAAQKLENVKEFSYKLLLKFKLLKMLKLLKMKFNLSSFTNQSWFLFLTKIKMSFLKEMPYLKETYNYIISRILQFRIAKLILSYEITFSNHFIVFLCKIYLQFNSRNFFQVWNIINQLIHNIGYVFHIIYSSEKLRSSQMTIIFINSFFSKTKQ